MRDLFAGGVLEEIGQIVPDISLIASRKAREDFRAGRIFVSIVQVPSKSRHVDMSRMCSLCNVPISTVQIMANVHVPVLI